MSVNLPTGTPGQFTTASYSVCAACKDRKCSTCTATKCLKCKAPAKLRGAKCV